MDVYIGLWIRNVIDCEDSSCTLVVNLTKGAVSLLPSCVPESDLDLLTVHGERFGVKFYAYRGLLVLKEFPLDVLCGDVGLASARVAYEHYFVELHLVIHSYY